VCAGGAVADAEGDTALHKSAYSGYADCIAVLVKRGANVNAQVALVLVAPCDESHVFWGKDRLGRTALRKAAYNGHTQCAEVRLSAPQELGALTVARYWSRAGPTCASQTASAAPRCTEPCTAATPSAPRSCCGSARTWRPGCVRSAGAFGRLMWWVRAGRRRRSAHSQGRVHVGCGLLGPAPGLRSGCECGQFQRYEHGRLAVTTFLVLTPASIPGQTPLFRACEFGTRDTVERLLQAVCDSRVQPLFPLLTST
jgi:ankyrin repeat protein